jgi:radical SAM protein with 4Fe4S-binding SPASM domain
MTFPKLSTILARPTRRCNAACQYCSAAGEPLIHEKSLWTFENFKTFFLNIKDSLAENALFLWHGGEPLLQEPAFYYQCQEFAWKYLPNLEFSVQSNFLLYTSEKWRKPFSDLFTGLSTSYDTHGDFRVLNGSAESYRQRFFQTLRYFREDNFQIGVIATFASRYSTAAQQLCDLADEYDDVIRSIRLNYRFPIGRAKDSTDLMSPDEYTQLLFEVLDRWILQKPKYALLQHSQIAEALSGRNLGRCPWSNSCFGSFLAVEPDFSTHNCIEFADYRPDLSFGSILDKTVPELFKSSGALSLRKLRLSTPIECSLCEYSAVCQGGCLRDTLLLSAPGHPFYYCETWKAVFKRINALKNTPAFEALLTSW